MKKFEFFDTTADIGLKVFGYNFLDILENAGLGVFSLIAELSHVQRVISKEIEVTGEYEEEILFSWLSDLIYIFDTEGLLFCDFKGKEISPFKFIFTVTGDKYSDKKHSLLTSIKGVTYHNLEIKRGNIWSVNIVFDA